MSKAEELLDSLSIEDIQPFTSEPDIEGHIVIDKDRIIHVPTELKRIAVQYDSNIETVTFDCPRYWDEHDLSEMNIYINYKLPGNLINNIGQSLVKNLRINEDDENIINFDWTIGPILTNNKGDLPFSVCAKSKTNQDSDEAIRWYTEINAELTISEGMDGSGDIEDNYEDLFPDVINDIISKLEGINATYDEKLEAFNTNATSKTESFDTNAETKTTEFNNNATTKTNEFDSNAIEKTEAFNANANGVLKKSNTFINGLMNAALTNEVEGVENVINDGIECPLFKMEVDGHTNEQVVTTGKNKLQITTFNDGTKSKTLNGVTANINENGTISLSGTASAETQFYLTKNDFSLESGDGYFWCNSPSTNCRFEFVASINGEEKYLNSYSTTPNTFNITSSFVYSGSTIIVASGTSTNITLTPMVSNGTFTEYEPYTGGQPSPSPDYPQEINSIEGSLEFACRGKNLLNNTLISGTRNGITYTVNEDKSVTLNGTATTMTWLILNNSITFSAGTYTMSQGNDNNNVRIFCSALNGYVENGIRTATLNEEKTSDVSINIPEGTTVSNFTIYPMIKEGSGTTEYEPYIEPNEVTFNLGQEKLRSVGDVKDELVVDLDTGDYYKVENVKEVVLTGTRFWANATEGNVTDGFSAYTTIPDISYVSGSANKILKCNKLKGVLYSNENIRNITNVVFGGYGNVVIVNVDRKYLDTPDINGFKNWVANNNVLLCYQLATPTTKKLGTLDADQLLKLATFKGYNYMTVTGIVDGELVNLNSRITYIQNANDYREIQNGKIAKMISNHPKQGIEGIDNTFDDAVDMELFEFGGDGKSEQVVTQGYNLIGVNDVEETTKNGLTYSIKNGLLKLNGTATALVPLGNILFNIPAEAGKYRFEIFPQNGTWKSGWLGVRGYVDGTQKWYQQIAKTNNTNYVINDRTVEELDGCNRCDVYVSSGSTFDNFRCYIQLKKGAEHSLYEPYTGGQPSPSPDYPQPITTLTFDKITRCGKNLATENFANQNNSINLARTLKKGEKITIVVNMTATDNPLSGYGINIYDQYNEQLWGNSYTNWQEPYDGWNSFVVTVKNDTSRLRINSYGYQEIEILTAVLSGALVVENKYVNDGSLYEPYQGQSYDVDLQDNEMVELPNGVKDELVIDKQGNISLIKNTGKAILTGSENWKDDWQTSATPDYIQFYLSADFLNNNYIQSTLRNMLVNRFKVDGSVWINSKEILALNKDVKYSLQIKMLRSRVSDLASFKEWLSTHNVIMYYQLARLQTIPLGTLSELITTLNGTNNISINGNIPTIISTTYGLDTKKYVDNKIAQLSEQLIKGE